MLFFLIVLAGAARAQFLIEEGKVVLSVSGGDRISRSVMVDSTVAEEMDVRVYWEDFKYLPPYDGAKQFLPAGTLDGSAAQWISYMPQEFKLPPYGKQRIDYTINVPEGIQGGHYGVLFFERSGQEVGGTHGVKIVTRVGCLFFIEAKDKSKTGDLKDINFSGNDLTGVFANNGNVVLIPYTTYYIMDEKGLVADRGEIPKLYIGPGDAAPWRMSLPSDLQPGRYTFFLNSDLEDGDVVVKEIIFVKDSSGGLVVEKVQD